MIADLCLKHDLLAITDEIYEHIVYDGAGHTPIATLPGMAERTITISGISKSYSVTGWRVGYAVASPELSLGIRRAHDFITVGAPHPLQEAAVTALELPDSYYTLSAGELSGAPRPPLRAGGGGRLRRLEAARRVLHPDRRRPLHEALRLRGRHRLRHAPHQGGRRRHRARARPSTPTRELGRTKIRFCFPKTDDMLIEAGRRLQKLAR